MLDNTNSRDRGQVRVASIIVTVAVVGLIAAVMLPVGLNAIAADSTTTATQAEDDSTSLSGTVDATVTNIDDTAGEVDVSLDDSESGSSTSVTVAEEGTETATLDGSDIEVTADSIDTDTASMSYSYPTSTGWGSGASALWGMLDVMIVLGAFLAFVGIALSATNRV